jgi:hypothetical protein
MRTDLYTTEANESTSIDGYRTETDPTMTPGTDGDTAPMMFATDDEVPIRGLFDAESDDRDA